jgi:hypothetical protein
MVVRLNDVYRCDAFAFVLLQLFNQDTKILLFSLQNVIHQSLDVIFFSALYGLASVPRMQARSWQLKVRTRGEVAKDDFIAVASALAN